MRIPIKALSLFIATALLTSCSFDDSSSLQGYIEGKYTYLASNFSGTLEKLFVTRGATVKKGNKLFSLDKNPELDELLTAQHNLAEATQQLDNLVKGQRQTVLASIKAQLAQAQAQLTYSKKTWVRYEDLYKKRSIDKSSVDEAESKYLLNQQRVREFQANLNEAKLGAREHLIQAQKATVAAAKAKVNQAQWQVSQKAMVAPVSALVFDTYFRVGEFVPASQPVLSLLAPNNIKLIFFAPEKKLSAISVGNKVSIQCDGCKKPYEATITFISPSAEYTPPIIFSRKSRGKLVYRVEAALGEDTLQLHPGQPVDVTLKPAQ